MFSLARLLSPVPGRVWLDAPGRHGCKGEPPATNRFHAAPLRGEDSVGSRRHPSPALLLCPAWRRGRCRRRTCCRGAPTRSVAGSPPGRRCSDICWAGSLRRKAHGGAGPTSPTLPHPRHKKGCLTSVGAEERVVGDGPWLGEGVELVEPLPGHIEPQKAGLPHGGQGHHLLPLAHSFLAALPGVGWDKGGSGVGATPRAGSPTFQAPLHPSTSHHPPHLSTPPYLSTFLISAPSMSQHPSCISAPFPISAPLISAASSSQRPSHLSTLCIS